MNKLRRIFPWPSIPPNVPRNMTGWFQEPKTVLLDEVIPKDVGLIVELGSWLGQSTRWFCRTFPKATVIAVDTWLGSCEHIVKKAAILPVLYETFLANNWELRERIIPFRNTSLAALNFIKHLGIVPDVVYFDSDHSYWGLTAEMETAHELFPKAIMVGDDFEFGNSVSTAVAGFIHPDARWKLETKNFSWHVYYEGEEK